MTKLYKYLSNFILGGTTLVLSSCLSQSPVEVVDKSHTYFGKNQPTQTVLNRATQEQSFANVTADSSGIVMQSLEPLKPASQTTEQHSDRKESTSGFLVSKTKTVKEVPAQTQQVAKPEPSHKISEDKFESTKSDVPNSGDLTFEEPETQAKQQVTATKPDFASISPLGISQFEWPVVGGKVVSRFGKNGNKFNEGINIAAPLGAPVTAAGDGKVIYIGNNIEGYGNMIIVKHSGDYMTAYSHVQEILVERGVQVKKGESIATIGKTGNVASPQLHFSVRKGKKTINPEGSAAG